MVCKSLFSVMVNASMMKPCGLLSLRVTFRRQEVTRLRSVTLLFTDDVLAGIRLHLVGILSKSHFTLSISTVCVTFPEITRL